MKHTLNTPPQITPVVDRQFYRSVQREVDILKVLNYKRVNRLHEIILDYEDCVILILSYQHQLYLLDFIQLKGVHRYVIAPPFPSPPTVTIVVSIKALLKGEGDPFPLK